jgi:ribosomal protein L14E/L6E/L27E
MNRCVIGQVVRSKAGRDKGQFMIVVGIPDDDYVLLCDGASRKISRPKKKKIKHIAPTRSIVYDIQVRLTSGQKIQNAEIRRWLSPWNGESPEDQKEEV